MADGRLNFNVDEEIDFNRVVPNMNSIQLSRFEPVRQVRVVSSNGSKIEVQSENVAVKLKNDRLDGNGWCACNTCVVTSTVEQCLCCREIGAISQKLEGNSNNHIEGKICLLSMKIILINIKLSLN